MLNKSATAFEMVTLLNSFYFNMPSTYVHALKHEKYSNRNTSCLVTYTCLAKTKLPKGKLLNAQNHLVWSCC